MPRSSVPPPSRQGKPREALDALFVAGNADPLHRALWLDALERQLRPHLPPTLAAHARFANVDGGRLVFLVDSPVWKARLRLSSAELLDAARSIGLQCSEVVVKVATSPREPVPPAARRPVPLSAATREALEAALASLKDGS
ncbi:MAG TPA: DUF721 domain-containing protein [Luteimonas sp.]|jgi:hypothetical protein|nr:DUF721 domain-containing protein [Luteimonas sp.]